MICGKPATSAAAMTNSLAAVRPELLALNDIFLISNHHSSTTQGSPR
jgi:hypothetical protein